jgi:septation ring formation regulator EzrA
MSSITFGSVGDIISVCLLAKKIVDTLDNTRGSSAEYRDLVTELRSLEKALLEAELVAGQHKHNKAAQPVLSEIPQLLTDCRSTHEKLRDDISKYEKHLAENAAPGLVKKLGMKVRWEVSAKAKVVSYRAQIAAHCNAINMMLVMQIASRQYLDPCTADGVAISQSRPTKHLVSPWLLTAP